MTVEPEDSGSVTRPHSPDNQGGNDRKRRRKVLSCYDCRRRKLQCDRAMPACGRCTKAGQAANCLYLDDANETPARDPDTGDRLLADRGPLGGYVTRTVPPPAQGGNVLGRLEFQDKRIRELEEALSQQNTANVQRLRSSKLPLTPESLAGGDHIAATIRDRETMLLRGKSFKTQFNGATNNSALIAYIPELNVFTKDAFSRFPALSRIRQNMKQLEDRTLYAGTKGRRTTDEEIRALLPPKSEADELVELYLESFDTIYHVVHVPTFRRQYEELWRNTQTARPHFIAVVLLMIAAARCLMPNQPWLYQANSSTAREHAVAAIEACDDWIQLQTQKHTTIEDFQIRFLLVVGKVINARKFKRCWTEAGTCLRFFMCAGLHRNPDLLRKPTSNLDKEMRRRLWAAITEYELQTAFDRGMVSTPWPMQSDCPPPGNIHDDELDGSTDVPPNHHPASEFTKSSYLSLISDSLLLRHQINTILNNIRQSISFEEGKRLTEEIESHLQNVPEWNSSASDSPNSDASQALLSITIRQYLIALHDRLLRQSSSTFERNFSRVILLDTATKMVTAHRTVVDKGNYTLVLLCQDFLRAALSVCHLYTTTDPRSDALLYKFVEEGAIRVVDEANELIADKVVRYGREQRQQWIALSAFGYMKARREPAKRLAYMQEVVDKITRPYYKILAYQQDASGGAEDAVVGTDGVPAGVVRKDPLRNEDMPNGVMEYLPVVEGQGTGDGVMSGSGAGADVGLGAAGGMIGENDPPLMDLDELAAWTFEDFAFNPVEYENLVDPYGVTVIPP